MSNNITAVKDPRFLVGVWSSSGPSGEMVDPITDLSKGVIYNVEMYTFREDGTYRYLIDGSGPIISGIAINEGKYGVQDGILTLSERRESWLPDPARGGQRPAYKGKPMEDETLEFTYDPGKDCLKINGEDYWRLKQDQGQGRQG